MPKVDLSSIAPASGPDRVSAILGPLGAFQGKSVSAAHALRHLGANVETLAPGSRSSHRHWHSHVDEIVVVLSGQLTLIEERDETPLNPGDIAIFKAGEANGHCLRNDSAGDASFFVVSSEDAADRCFYADADLVAEPDGSLRRADGTIVTSDERPA